MKVSTVEIPGLLVIEPQVFGDARGFFLETYNAARYREAGLGATFVQDNLSFSRRGILRGMHAQNPSPQGKLVSVLQGEVYDVAIDGRVGSPTFGKWYGITLSSENKTQFYVPPGFFHGFCVTSETALFSYKCTDLYMPKNEVAMIWNDPDVGVKWPVSEPQLSAKDQVAPRLKDIPAERLLKFEEASR